MKAMTNELKPIFQLILPKVLLQVLEIKVGQIFQAQYEYSLFRIGTYIHGWTVSIID